jgi:Zn-dependent protease
MDQFFLKLSIVLVPILMAITCHEVSHGFVAYRLGDGTAKAQGRLTLNPLNHIDLFGTIIFPIICLYSFGAAIGWAKPVPVNFNNLRHPKRDMIWVAAAGPVTNFCLAVISAVLMRGLAAAGERVSDASVMQYLIDPLLRMLAFSIFVNLLLAIFNLIPLPPLDGGRVAVGMLPLRQAAALARIEPYGMIIIIVLVFFTNLFSYIILPALQMGVHLLAGPQSTLVFSVMTNLLMK